MIKECHRWRPIIPLGIPHATTEEINVRFLHKRLYCLNYSSKQYRDFRIPVGTIIFINSWGMSLDPEVHERPEEFWPDRWISPKSGTKSGVDENDVRNHAWFGSGRRSCPGIHLATNSLVNQLLV
jgi:hypothetical protein